MKVARAVFRGEGGRDTTLLLDAYQGSSQQTFCFCGADTWDEL
jgi:hypothetical protein